MRSRFQAAADRLYLFPRRADASGYNQAGITKRRGAGTVCQWMLGAAEHPVRVAEQDYRDLSEMRGRFE